MTYQEICERAAGCKELKYWYGGKGELATVELANRLRAENPKNWTASYFNKALMDVDGHTHVGDCSYLVCHAYGIGMISSYGIEAHYKKWSGQPKSGMILWRKGHVGIYDNGRVHELKGIDYDYRFDPYVASSWSEILYDPEISYEEPAYPIGWNRCMDPPSLNYLKWWYQYGPDRKDYYANCIAKINDSYYAFDKDGYMIEGSAKIRMDENGEIIGVE